METASSSDPSGDTHLSAAKRAYLGLLPPPQVIELCLAFEAYAPAHVKSLIWPVDVDGAIAVLRAQQVPTAKNDKPQDVPPPSTYPHAPYHPLPYPPPPSVYPHYPHPSTNPHFPPPYPLPPSEGSQMPGDDLPSYEEMIVEALKDVNDPEGSQPRNLFSWMASHYPLQTNFRPSASQALQKAFKRGRLEKASGGKYRLNPSWEGGNTSRRTTRRPQTQAQTTLAIQQSQPGLAPPTTSPFTQMPLHRPPPTSSLSPSLLPHPFPVYPHPYQPPPFLPTPSNTIAAPKGDAWEAAQSILKAINFGGVSISPSNDDKIPEQRTTMVLDPSLSADATAPPPTESTPIERRAELQAQLALLAAQLADIAGDGLRSLPVSKERKMVETIVAQDA